MGLFRAASAAALAAEAAEGGGVDGVGGLRESDVTVEREGESKQPIVSL